MNDDTPKPLLNPLFPMAPLETYAQKPRNKNETEQSVGTPWEFIDAVEKRFGPLIYDLAADANNSKVREEFGGYFDEDADSLKQPWAQLLPQGNLWLNPPFKDIAPWAEKCALESRTRHGLILLLVPASIGSVWYSQHVLGQSVVLGLSPRMTFIGHDKPYPKDLMLCVYGYGLVGHTSWRWR